MNGGQILHIDVTTTGIRNGHLTFTWRQETYQETSPPYQARTIKKHVLEIPPGTDGLWGVRQAVYDPTTNTIYEPSGEAGIITVDCSSGSGNGGKSSAVLPAQEPWMREPAMAQYIPDLRAKLASGEAQVDGRATVDGRDVLKIRFAGGEEIDYVAADGSMVPIKTVWTSSSEDHQRISVYHTFEFLPAAGNADLLSLTAQYPTARVDRSLSAYRAAQRRLYRRG